MPEPLERRRELRKRQPLAYARTPPLDRVHRIPLRRMPKQRIEDPVQIRPCLGHHEPLAREPHRRRHELRPRDPAPPAMRRLEPERGPRNRHRGRTGPEKLLRIAVEIHRQLEQIGRRHPVWDADEEIDY